MISGMDSAGQQAARAAAEYIIKEAYDSNELLTEEEHAIVEMHAAGTLAWLVTRWRSEGPEIEQIGKTCIAAALETTAHLEDLVRMDEDE